MNSNTIKSRYLLLSAMILAAAFTRFIPHPPNFTAVAAIALFGGAYFEKRIFAFVVPLTAMLLSDLIIGFHPGMIAVYVSFALIVLMGISIRNNKKPARIFTASVTSSVLFFVITNFAQWVTDPFYAKNASGLAQCYVLAIPFFHYTLLGDLFFVGVMFGAYELVKVRFPGLSKAQA